MRIVIDLQGAQTESRFRGIGRYSLSLAKAIIRNAGEHEILLALNGAFPESVQFIRHEFQDSLPMDRIRIFRIPSPVAEYDRSHSERSRAAELMREHFLEQLEPDFLLVTSLFEGYIDDAVTSVGLFSSIPTAAILYDLIPYLSPEKYLPTKIQYDCYANKIASLQKTDLLLAISASTRQEGIQTLNIPHDKIVNISTAVDERFQSIELSDDTRQKLFKKYAITRKMVMYAPGGFDERKNFETLIKAYGKLPKHLRDDYQLVIVSKVHEGDRVHLKNIARNAALKDDELLMTGYVPDDELIALYNSCALFVFPSKHEGFGLPVLEAMSCGAAVIGSNNTSIPEVIGWDRALFNPDSIESVQQKIQEALENAEFLGQLKEHAKKRSKHFSWDESAKKALTAIEKSTQNTSFQYKKSQYDLINSIAALKIDWSEKDLVMIAHSIAFNAFKNRSKQLLLDISEIVRSDAKSGIQRVVRNILHEILMTPPKDYIVAPIYFDGHIYRYAQHFQKEFCQLKDDAPVEDSPAEFNQDDIYLALDLNAHLTPFIHELHKYLRTYGVKVYFIVYDLLLIQYPHWWPSGTSTIFETWVKSISDNASGLICISDAVAQDLKQWLSHNPPNRPDLPEVTSFHLGANIDNSIPSSGMPENAIFVLNQLKSAPTFLTVGTVEPRKGHKQTLEAFEKLWADDIDCHFVIVGKEGWMVDQLAAKMRNHPERNKRLFWLEGISDEYLEKIYAASTCLIAASEGEGFGLPLIEAAQHKLPIIARDIPVFREVAGEYAYYFANDKDPSVLVDTINDWLYLYKHETHPKSDNMPWLTWEESASQLMNILLRKV